MKKSKKEARKNLRREIKKYISEVNIIEIITSLFTPKTPLKIAIRAFGGTLATLKCQKLNLGNPRRFQEKPLYRVAGRKEGNVWGLFIIGIVFGLKYLYYFIYIYIYIYYIKKKEQQLIIYIYIYKEEQ